MSDDAKLFGRKWQLTVNLQDGKTALDLHGGPFDEPEGLRVQFRVEQPMYHFYPSAEIIIYNLSYDTEQQIIQEGASVILQAGYVNGNYGKIYEGKVFQPMRDRENVTDYRLTLICEDALYMQERSMVRFTQAAGQNSRDQVANICRQSGIDEGYVSDNLPDQKLPRGKTYFGDPNRYLRSSAKHCSAQWWVSEGKVNVGMPEDVSPGEALVLSPQTGLVGTPQQIEYGVFFRALLDPRIRIKPEKWMLVKLDNVLIRQMKKRIGQDKLSVLDQDLLFQVVGVAYTGDTRGNEWYVDVTGVNSQGAFNPQVYGQNLPELLRGGREDMN